MLTWTFWDQLAQDVRYTFRAMAGSKLFTLMAMLSLALGIGANTAIYSFMDAIMVRALPVKHPEELVILNWRAKKDAPVVHNHWGTSYTNPGGGETSPNFPYQAYELLRDDNNVLTSLFGHAAAGRMNVIIDGHAELADGQYATGNFFSGLGVPAVVGRAIGPDDDRMGAPPVVIITFDYWRARFAASPSVVGKTIQINATPFTIAGVAAPEFYGVSPANKPAIFIPMADIGFTDLRPDWAEKFHQKDFYWIELMGRLKPGVSLARADAQLASLFHGFVESTATKDRERADLPALWLQEGGSGVDALRRNYSKPLSVLMAMVGLILMIACANTANLLLARAAGRRREMAVRLSLGAGRYRVIRQLLTESTLLALLGGVAGLGVAALSIRGLLLLLTNGLDNFSVVVGLDLRVLAFTFGVALVTGILFGLAPALQAIRVDITPALKETRASAITGRRRRFGLHFGLSHVLVVSQIGMSLILVAGAGLFVRTLANLHSVNLGFNAENVLTFQLDASKAGYKDAALKRYYDNLQHRLESIPGVRGATSIDLPMVNNWSNTTGISVPGIPDPPEGQRGPNTAIAQVGATFFETMQIPILAGRAIGKQDVDGAPTVGVVNEIFAKKYFNGQNPVGRHFTLGRGKNAVEIEIVGLAKTARYDSLKRDIPPVTYVSWRQSSASRRMSFMFFNVRAYGDPMALANSVRRIVHEAGPRVPVADMATQTERIDRTIVQERTLARLCTCFGVLALAMACVGLYGTTAYAVSRRTNEIGIRMALGAERGRISRMILKEVLALCAAGLAIGFAAFYETTVFVKSFLFGLKPDDPYVLGVSLSVLVASAALAGYLPARRASRVDPMTALRYE